MILDDLALSGGVAPAGGECELQLSNGHRLLFVEKFFQFLEVDLLVDGMRMDTEGEEELWVVIELPVPTPLVLEYKISYDSPQIRCCGIE